MDVNVHRLQNSYVSFLGVKDDTLFKKPREIVHKNTRFNGDPFSKTLNKSQIQQAAALNAQVTSKNMFNERYSKNESYPVLTILIL